MGRISCLLILAVAASLLTACRDDARTAGETAFVGTHKIELLAELSPEADVVARLHHGDKVRIVARRRRFARIRTEDGVEGWTDGHALLNPGQMSRLRELSRRAAALPSHGEATVYGALNVHTAPHRQAPSFFQLGEGDRVAVVAHTIQKRGSYQPEVDGALLPAPLWRLPPDWTPPPEGADDWALVRIPDGRAGWVLARMLVMAIPDEVAQYAEGHRITSYFSLGRAGGDGAGKHHWLWTTVAGPLKPFQFDSFRVFVWNRRRHRYETAHIERNLAGYFPVDVQPAPKDAAGGAVRFSLVVRERDGRLWRKTYLFSGYRVRLLEGMPWEPPPEDDALLIVEPEPEPAAAGQGPFQGLWHRLQSWFD